MPFMLEPQAAGELGEATRLDLSEHPPLVSDLEIVLDFARTDDLIESYPVFLVTERLADRLAHGGLAGFSLEPATVSLRPDPFEQAPAPLARYLRLLPEAGAAEPDVWIDEDLMLCVSDRMMAVLSEFVLRLCDDSGLHG